MTFSFSNTFWAQTFRHCLILGLVALGPALGSVQNEDALYQEGVRLRKSEHYKEAITYFQPLANKGDAKAQHNMGSCYYHLNRPQDAKTWWEKAADQGLDAAIANLKKLKLELSEKETPFKGNWTRLFTLITGATVFHTPTGIEISGLYGSGKICVGKGFTTIINNNLFDIKTDSTEQEFVQALLGSGLYKP
jgi:TPR repeat protein